MRKLLNGRTVRSMALEVLDFPLVLFCGGTRTEGAEVAALARFRVDLA
jgi:hypothetical protein